MPYYIGDVIKEEKKLIARTPEKFRETGIDVRINTRVEEVDEKAGQVRLSDGTALPFDVLVLGMGTKPLMPGIPGEDLEGVFTLKKYADALRIKARLRDLPCRKAIIVGAGFIGMEMSEAIRNLGIETQVFHRGALPVNRWDPEFGKVILAELGRHEVGFVTDVETRAVEKGKEYRLRLITNHGEDEADMILMAVGIRPDTELARRMGLPLGKTGAIQVNFSQQTPREGVYAVGDCAESFHRVSRRWVNIPLGDIANKQGRVAGWNIGGGNMIFPGDRGGAVLQGLRSGSRGDGTRRTRGGGGRFPSGEHADLGKFHRRFHAGKQETGAQADRRPGDGETSRRAGGWRDGGGEPDQHPFSRPLGGIDPR